MGSLTGYYLLVDMVDFMVIDFILKTFTHCFTDSVPSRFLAGIFFRFSTLSFFSINKYGASS